MDGAGGARQGHGAVPPPLRLGEAVPLAVLAALVVLVAESAVLVVLQPHYLETLGREALALELRYAAAFALLGSGAWLLGLPLRRLAPRRARVAQLALVAVACAIPVLLGGVALRPSLAQRVPFGGLLLALGVGAAVVVGAALRCGPRGGARLLAALGVGLAAGAALQTWALQHLPGQLLSGTGLLGLLAVAVAAGLAALALLRVLRPLRVEVAARIPLALGAGLAVLLAAAGLLAPQAARVAERPGGGPPAEPPSVLWVVADTLRADRAADADLAPNLAGFAADGVRFERAHAGAPWTLPSFASMLTSQYPAEHRAGSRLPGSGLKRALGEGAVTLPGLLGEQGFETAAVLTNATLSPRYGLGRDFADYRDLLAPRFYHPVAFWLGRLASRIAPEAPAYLPAVVQQRRILEGVDRARAGGRPFFLLAQFMDPHQPYAAPRTFYAVSPETASVEEHYAAEVRYFDDAFGALLDGLRERGLYDELVIVFSADHGEEIGERRDDRQRVLHGHTLFQELVHVPLIIKLPRGRLAGTARSETVSLVDVAPTVLGLLGLPRPEAFRGRDLFAPTAADAEAVIFAGGLRLGPEQQAAIRGDRKLVATRLPVEAGHLSAFDLSRDPGERQPLGDPEAAPWVQPLLAALRAARREEGESDPAAAVEVDPLLREQLGALGYAE